MLFGVLVCQSVGQAGAANYSGGPVTAAYNGENARAFQATTCLSLGSVTPLCSRLPSASLYLASGDDDSQLEDLDVLVPG